MSYNLPPLPWLRAFEAAARLGNFTLAADELALTPAAISHQVRTLEERMGYPLFLRRNRQLILTRQGEAYLPSVRAAFQDLSLATSDVFGRAQAATLRVRSLHSFAEAWLIPRLPKFRAAHPEVRMQLHTASWAGTVESEQLDLDLTYGSGDWPGHEAERLLGGTILPLAAPDLAAQVDALEDLATAPLIEVAGVTESWTRFFQRHGGDHDLPPPVSVVDQSSVALEFAAQGAGHCLVFEPFAEQFLKDGRLVQSLALTGRADQGVYMLHSPVGRRANPDLEVFLTWLRAEAAA